MISLRNILFFIGVLNLNISFCQFTYGFGLENSFLKVNGEYHPWVSVYNENETVDLYRLRNQIGVSSQGFSLRNFGGQFLNTKDFSFGYSLELGYHFFKSQSQFVYIGSSTSDRDSIVNLYDDFKFHTRYHNVYVRNFLDAHWNLSETIKWSNSIGVGLHALVKYHAVNYGYDGSVFNTNHPIIKLIYQTQITEQYEDFSISYFANIDLYSFAIFTKNYNYSIPDFRIGYNKIHFNSIGLRFIPHFNKSDDQRIIY
ncbi:hypothetical protein [Crocinitomix algicola]|uniref:hypothetical protein n=1 Tax=Crocinitomix algicola TaxID=1740263 RepID=UPI0008733E91|nr:hypothetical protein [Crocinitomix algicola]